MASFVVVFVCSLNVLVCVVFDFLCDVLWLAFCVALLWSNVYV